MKILYASPLCSEKVLNYMFRSSSINQELAVQKFHHLLIEGLSMYAKVCSVETLTIISITPSSHKKRFWNIPSEKDRNIRYNYIPMINWPVLKSIIILINSFFQLSFLILSGGRKEKIILCDILYLPLLISVFMVSKLFKVKSIAIVTDLPDYVADFKNRGKLVKTISKKVSYCILPKFNAYVLLTEEMNKIVNTRNKPYLIMEGLVDISMKSSNNSLKNKNDERILLYAGNLYERNGIKKLIEAFLHLEGKNLRFHIYGSGEMEKDMPYYMNLDNRIIYQGIFPNKVIVEKELEATLLLNPRPSNEEFTKYSFPSKNMEYMVSGTPIVTTPLPGMPVEYYDYVYLFDDETVHGFLKTLRYLLSLNEEKLHEKGRQAKEFVLKNKNNMIQAKRILDLCSC